MRAGVIPSPVSSQPPPPGCLVIVTDRAYFIPALLGLMTLGLLVSWLLEKREVNLRRREMQGVGRPAMECDLICLAEHGEEESGTLCNCHLHHCQETREAGSLNSGANSQKFCSCDLNSSQPEDASETPGSLSDAEKLGGPQTRSSEQEGGLQSPAGPNNAPERGVTGGSSNTDDRSQSSVFSRLRGHAQVELVGAETPFLSQEARDKLEFNVKNKIVQRRWGLPEMVQQSQDAFIPAAPPLRVSRMLPTPSCDVQPASCDVPLLTEEQKQELMNCVQQKQTQGHPALVKESCKSFEMPSSLSEELRAAAHVTEQAEAKQQASESSDSAAVKKKKGRSKDNRSKSHAGKSMDTVD